MEVAFLVNARRETLKPQIAAQLALRGYLVPPAYLTAPLRKTISAPKRFWPGPTVIDDGLFDDISRIAAHPLVQPQATVAKQLDAVAAHSRTRQQLPKALRDWVDRCVAQIDTLASHATPFALADALNLNPSAVVGVERIEAAVWFRVGIEPPWVTQGYQRLARMNTKIARQTVASARKKLCAAVEDLPVVCASDYDSAYAAGRIFAQAGVQAAALPFGAYMADSRSADSYRMAGRKVDLGAHYTLRPIRCVLVARGFMDGWRSVSAKPPVHIHLLGLGQPLVLALTLLPFRGVKQVTCDATSPFKDAADGVIYTEQPVFRKLKAAAVTAHLLGKATGHWDCPCPYCTQAQTAQSWATARALLGRLSPAEQTRALTMGKDSKLAKPLAYFAQPATAQMAQLRALHNHWVVIRSIDQLNQVAPSSRALERFVRKSIQSYRTAVGKDSYADAFVRACDIAVQRADH